MKPLAIASSVLAAIVCAGLAGNILTTGQVFVPGSTSWARGYVGGVGAYAMAASWLALGAAALFAGCMRAFPERYFHHRQRRNVSLVAFGALFLLAVVGFIIERSGVRAF